MSPTVFGRCHLPYSEAVTLHMHMHMPIPHANRMGKALEMIREAALLYRCTPQLQIASPRRRLTTTCTCTSVDEEIQAAAQDRPT